MQAEKDRLTHLSAFDFLLYASLYAFECLVGKDIAAMKAGQGDESRTELAWHAINHLLAWKLQTADESSLKLNDASIGLSLARHLRPILFDEERGGASEAVQAFHAFHALLDTQIPDGHPKLLHCWPVKLLQAGRGDYAGSEVMIRRAAASLSL